MRALIIGLAGFVALAAVPASAATVLREDFESGANGGFGIFANVGNVQVTTGQAYKDIGFDGNDPAKLANHVAAFGGRNSNVSGNILSKTVAGDSTATMLYTFDFDAGYIGRAGADIDSQYLLFSVNDVLNNSLTATLQPGGGAGADVLGGSGNVDTVFTRYRYQFKGTGPISFNFSAGGSRGDNADVLLDNVLVSAQAVPETSTWAMMIIGLGTVGGTLRRLRRTPLRARATA